MITKVSVIGTLPPVKGISAYTLEFCAALARLCAVDFIGFRRLYPEFLYPGGTVDPSASPVEIPNARQRNILSWSNPLSWIRAGFAFDGPVVHAQWWSFVLAPVFAVMLAIARMRGKKVVLTIHNIAPHEKARWKELLNRSLFRFGDAWIVHSRQNRETLCAVYGMPEDRVHVISHGILAPRGPDISRENARAALGIGDDEKVVLAFGNVRGYKATDVLIKAFRAMNVPGRRLIVAGKFWEDRARYDELAGGDPSITFIDEFIPLDEVPKYFRAADLAALPYSHFDAASGVGGYALHFGLPMVVSDAGSLPDLVSDSESCVVRAGDEDELRVKMERILTDDELSARLAREALVKREEFGWDAIAKMTMAVYRQVMAG